MIEEGEIPNEFIFYKDKDYPEVSGSVHNEEQQLFTMSFLKYLRGLVYARSRKPTQEQQTHDKGYRFPLHDLITKEDRPQVKFLSNKFDKDKKKRISNVWLYYYPSTADVKHDHLTNFLKFNFPDPGERPFIDAVLSHKNTEAFCIAVHDSVFVHETRERTTQSNIIALISFRLLKNLDYSGVFIYYLTALQDRTFNEVCSSGSFQNMRCPIESNGLGEFLLRNTQLFKSCMRDSYAIYLAVNRTAQVISYYNQLGFTQHSSFTEVPELVRSELQECILLESNSLGLYHLLSKVTELICPDLNAQSLLHRHCAEVPRPLESLTENPSDGYMKLIATLFDMKLQEHFSFDEYTDRCAYEQTDQEYASMFQNTGEAMPQGKDDLKQYRSSGKAWEKFHKLWSKENMVNFWDFKKEYKTLLKKKKVQAFRCQEVIMPLEHFLMEYCSVGRLIKDNDCKKNTQFNIYCQFCQNNMTENPLTQQCVERYSTQIIQAHWTGRDSHILSYNSPAAMAEFRSPRLREKYSIALCKGLSTKANYTKLFKACLQDYGVARANRQVIGVGTNQIFQAFFRQYISGNYYKEFFARMIKASGKNLFRLDGNRFNFTPEIKELIKWAAPKDYEYGKHQKKIFNSIVDKSTREWFFERQKPLKRCKTQSDSPKPSRQKADRYKDVDLKLNWKTLMAFNAHRWDPKVTMPSVVINISTELDEIHYVARSDIKGEHVFFLVSDNIIPKEPPQYIFDATFLNNMEINKEIEIPNKSKERLESTARRYLGKCITHIYPQGKVDGKYVYHGKQHNGHFDKTIPQEWIDLNFKDRFPEDYEKFMDEDNIGKACEVPSGAIYLSDSDSDEDENGKIPSRFVTKKIVQYQFENKNCCAFGNMANAVNLLGDEKAAQFFFHHRNGNMDDLRADYTKIHQKASINSFHLAREILRQKFRYNVKFIKGVDLVDIVETNKNEMLYVMLQPADAIVTHVISIFHKRSIDGTFAHQLKCNEETLRWLCSDSDYSFHGYILEMSATLKTTLGQK